MMILLKQANTATTQETAALSDQLETAQATQQATQQISHQRQLDLEHQATRMEELKNQVTEYENLHRNESGRIAELEEALHEANESLEQLQVIQHNTAQPIHTNTDYKDTVIRTLAVRISDGATATSAGSRNTSNRTATGSHYYETS